MKPGSFESEHPPLYKADSVKKPAELNGQQMRESLRDSDFLPSYDNLSHIFKNLGFQSEWHEWRDFNQEIGMSEFWTREYIKAFGNYLAERVRELRTANGEITILEVAAGNGRLSHHLQQELEAVVPGQVKVIATDSGKHKIKPDFPVEHLDYKAALEKYKPQIVIVSWMPYGLDFTHDFRAVQSVQEYILIGEPDRHLCGLEWETWGIDNPYAPVDKGSRPPYEQEGFEKLYHDDLAQLQLSHLDIDEGAHRRTGTVSFKRR